MKICSSRACPKKGEPQPLTEFGPNKYTRDGKEYYCRVCKRASAARVRAKHRAKHADPTHFEITVDAPADNPPPRLSVEAHPGGVIPSAPTPPPSTGERLEIARLKAQLTELKTYSKELESQILSGDNLRAILGTLGLPNVTAQPEWLKGAKDPRSTTGTPVLFISDVHADEVVNPLEIGGCNEFNREICTRRLRNTFRNSIILTKRYMATPRYDGIVCALGGDMVSGNIHDELTETNEYAIQETLLYLEEILIEGIGGLADEFGKVHVPCVTGNHGRMHKKPRAKQRAIHNFEWAVYQRVAGYFKRDTRITFDIPEGPDAFFDVYSRRICLTHGDQFRGGNGIGGIMVPIQRGMAKKAQRQVAMGQPFDLMMIGHWHQYIHTNGLVINGSVKGYDEYASANNFGFEEPQQALWIEHPKAGATFRMPVLCDKEG
jgi:hypothetical protein